LGQSFHGPARFRAYIRVHENRIEQLRASGFLLRETLVFTALPGTLTLEGEVVCKRGIVVRVYKTLEVLEGEGDDALVQTVRYAYNAHIAGHGTFLRVDNAHSHPGHPDAHHRHDGNWRTGEESVVWVGKEGWPTLGAFFAMVEDWYWEHCDELPLDE
jgi:hypothetical protein